METLFGRQIVLSRRKKMVKDNSLGAKVDLFLILNTDANQKMPKKNRVKGTLTAWDTIHHFIKFYFKVRFTLACLA